MSIEPSDKQTHNETGEESKKQQIFIVGMGAVTPFGHGINALDSALRAGNCAIQTSNGYYPDLPFKLLAATIDDFPFTSTCDLFPWPENKSTLHKIGRRLPLALKAPIIAALEAWHHSRLHQDKIDAARIGLIIAGANTTNHYQYQKIEDFKKEPLYLSPLYALHMMDTNLVGIISDIFGLYGEGFTIGGASASGSLAILHGNRMLQSNAADICIVIGAMADLSPMDIQGFHNIGAMDGRHYQDNPEQASRPFDTQSEGFIYGQGTSCLILETESSTKKRNIQRQAELLSATQVLDSNRLSNPSVEGELRAMQQALWEANLKPTEIDYINTHGTSSPLGDKTEMEALRAVFDNHLNQNNCYINATKGLIGHTLWSAGIIEAIATVLQLQGHYVHPNKNLETPIDTDAHFVGETMQEVNITTALSNSFGFGGINSSIIIRK